MKPDDCPKYKSCNANICPLDNEFWKRTHIDGEAVCVYMSEYTKPTRERLKEVIEVEHYEAIERVFLYVFSIYAPIRKALKRAAGTPSRVFKDEKEAKHV